MNRRNNNSFFFFHFHFQTDKKAKNKTQIFEEIQWTFLVDSFDNQCDDFGGFNWIYTI